MTKLTICIPSYNRPVQLRRLLNSIEINNSFTCQILIIDDCSPKQREITACIEEFKELSQFITYIPLKQNVGFDENALNLINHAEGEFLLFVTDDDIINSEYLEKTISYISNSNAKLAVTAYTSSNSNNINRVFKSSFDSILCSSKDYVKCIYNCILLSGIIISRSEILKLNIKEVKGMIYSQVFWSSLIASKHGIAYIKYPLITIFADGEVGWGKNSGEPSNEFLADRKNIFSPIFYHKALFKTILRTQENVKLKFFQRFIYEYSIRSYQLFIRAYVIGKRKGVYLFFKSFLNEKFPLKQNYIFIFIYFFIILIFGRFIERFSKILFSKSPAQIFKKIKGVD